MERIRQAAAALIALAAAAAPAAAKDCDPTYPARILRLLGNPDEKVDTSTERPRPLMPALIFEYYRAGVRVAFLADAPPGSPPPYRSWCLLGFVDTTRDAPIDFDLARGKTSMYR